AVLAELQRWRVDAIVVLPSGTSYRRLAAILARMLSASPHRLDGAYVFTGVRRLTARALGSTTPAASG
ncbi:MAG TPA: hypothetical protein VKU92_11040, partial [Acidimicrobiales bacterium]|nr:hypothetical protein [Acidimicrobiales bacterium]